MQDTTGTGGVTVYYRGRNFIILAGQSMAVDLKEAIDYDAGTTADYRDDLRVTVVEEISGYEATAYWINDLPFYVDDLTSSIDFFKIQPLESRAGYWSPLPRRWPAPVLPVRAVRPVRAQARACRSDARRWKRRRFLQALRRAR